MDILNEAQPLHLISDELVHIREFGTKSHLHIPTIGSYGCFHGSQWLIRYPTATQARTRSLSYRQGNLCTLSYISLTTVTVAQCLSTATKRRMGGTYVRLHWLPTNYSLSARNNYSWPSLRVTESFVSISNVEKFGCKRALITIHTGVSTWSVRLVANTRLSAISASRQTALKADKKTPWPQCASELYRRSDRVLSAKLVPTFLRIEGATWSAWRIPKAVFSAF
jgi:hypothetical protein